MSITKMTNEGSNATQSTTATAASAAAKSETREEMVHWLNQREETTFSEYLICCINIVLYLFIYLLCCWMVFGAVERELNEADIYNGSAMQLNMCACILP